MWFLVTPHIKAKWILDLVAPKFLYKRESVTSGFKSPRSISKLMPCSADTESLVAWENSRICIKTCNFGTNPRPQNSQTSSSLEISWPQHTTSSAKNTKQPTCAKSWWLLHHIRIDPCCVCHFSNSCLWSLLRELQRRRGNRNDALWDSLLPFLSIPHPPFTPCSTHALILCNATKHDVVHISTRVKWSC